MKGTCTLMHKGDKVATCVFDARGYLKSISHVHNRNLLPVCIGEENPVLDLQRWILTRTLATNRKDITERREFYGSSAFQSSTGISLFDCYWFANERQNDWEKENAFDNWNHKKDSLYLMLAKAKELEEINLSSPNLTVPGKNQRFWYRSDGQLCLLHGNAQKEMQEYKLADRNPVVAERSYVILTGKVYVMTQADTSKDVEQICFEDLYNTCRDTQKSKMENLKICCEKYGISNWQQFFSNVCAFDDAIGNTDRELCDIKVLRDSNTLEIIGFAKL